MSFWIVFAAVHAHHDCDIFTLGRGGNDDLLGTGSDVAFGLFRFREQARRFNDDIDAILLPWQFGRRLGAHHVNVLTVNDQNVVFHFVRAGFLRGHFTGKPPLSRVIFQEISEIVSGDDISHGDHLKVFADQTLLNHRTKHQPSNTAKSINRNLHRHNTSPDQKGSAGKAPEWTTSKVFKEVARTSLRPTTTRF